MLLNMFMVFGVMQTGDLVCMHKLIRTNKFVKPVNVNKLTKLNKSFKPLNLKCIHVRKFAKSRLTTRRLGDIFLTSLGVVSIGGLTTMFLSGVVGCFNDYRRRGIETERESEVFDMCYNLRYLLEHEPKNINKARVIINQPKLVDYMNEVAFEGRLNYHGFLIRSSAVEYFCNVISKAVNENNQQMVRLFSTKFPIQREHLFPVEETVFRKFLYVENHEDPAGMARLLIDWPNSKKMLKKFDYNCNSYANKTGCEIIQEKAKEIRCARHNEYVKSLKNSSKN